MGGNSNETNFNKQQDARIKITCLWDSSCVLICRFFPLNFQKATSAFLTVHFLLSIGTHAICCSMQLLHLNTSGCKYRRSLSGAQRVSPVTKNISLLTERHLVTSSPPHLDYNYYCSTSLHLSVTM